MVGRDGKRLQLFVRRASAVSHALWPENLRRGVATGKSAQRRRYIIINANWWPELLRVSQILLPLALVFISMVFGGALVASVVLSAWYLLLIPLAVISVLLTAVTAVAARTLNVDWRSSLQAMQRLQKRSSSLLAHADEKTPFPTMPHAPETPMPEANPLVRILETYDLSSSNVEHFLIPEDDDEPETDTAEYPIYQAPARSSYSFPPPTPV